MTLLYLALCYLVGIVAGHLLWQNGALGCDLPRWLWTLPLATLPFTFWWQHQATATTASPLRWPISAGFVPPRPVVSTALLVGLGLTFAVGLLRYASHPVTPCLTAHDLAYYNLPANADGGERVTLLGSVVNYPTVKDGRQALHLRVESLRLSNGESRAVVGEVRISTGSRPRYHYGDTISANGLLEEPPILDGFDYRAYLARKGVHSLLQSPRLEMIGSGGNPFMRALYALRARGEALINRLLPEPYAALANGMLLGIESGIPDDLYDQFNGTGTSHVIVISGSNVAIVAGVLVAVAARLLGRRRSLWPALCGIALYVLLVGGDAAVMRAGLMGSLVVIASVLNRRSTALISLAFACWVMTLLNPLTLWDVGFQLSAAATAGLILFSPGMSAALDRLWPGFGQSGHLTGQGGMGEAGGSLLRGLIQDGLLMTLAANLTTLPLVVHYFERLSVISPLTNLLIAPVQPLIMLWGGAGLLVGMSGLDFIAQPLLWIAYLSLLWTVTLVRWTAALPGASMEIVGYGGGALALTYLLLAWLRWRGWLRQRVERLRGMEWSAFAWGRLAGRGTLAGMAVAAFLLWRALLSGPDGYLHVYFLDIGQGDGMLDSDAVGSASVD